MDALQVVGALHLSGFQATNAAGDVMFDVEPRGGDV